MSSSTLAAGVRHLRVRLAAQRDHNNSDEQLLYAFTTHRDENAFAVLVRRHGPMVLHVCRRVLGHQQDAEDAFQATFLVLARNAASLRNKTALASWLHGTAYRTAMKAKQSAARRRKYEGQTPSRSPADPAGELLWHEVRVLLDEEIARLPEIYRSAFVLCSLESASLAEAAKRLGVKEGTVSSRLTEARKRLQRRLARRGVELTALLGAAALATPPASALPAGLIAGTIKTALAMAAGKGLAGVVSASVAELVQGAAPAMMVSKAKVATGVLLAASMLASASVWTYHGLAVNALTPAEPPAAKADDKPQTEPAKRETMKTVEIHGRILDPDGKPKAGAKLLLLGKPQQLGTTAADGRFTIAIPKEAKDGNLIAQADGFGIDFIDLGKWKPGQVVELRLVKDHLIRGWVVNTEGKPVAGVCVAVKSVNLYSNNSLDSFLAAWKKRCPMSGIPSGEKHLWTEVAELLPTKTDAEGRFVLRGVGNERLAALRLSGAGIAEVEAWIVNRDGFDPKPYNQATLDNTPKGFESAATRWMLHGPQVSIVAEAEKPIRGMVQDADSGKGRPGVVVRLTRINRGDLVAPIAEAKTDAAGHYQIHGARKVKRYMLEVAADTKTGYMPCQVWADDTPGYQPLTADLKVKKGVIITGKILDGSTGKPIRGFAMAAVLNDNPFAKNYPSFDNSAWFSSRDSNADGTFRVVAIPGPVLLMGGPRSWPRFEFKMPQPDPKYPHYFRTNFPYFPEYYAYGGGMTPVQGNFCKVLQIKPDAEIVKQDIILQRASVLPVHIQDADGKPLSGVWVTGSSPGEWHHPVQCDKPECSAYQLEANKPRLMVFFHSERHLAGTLMLKGDEKEAVTVKLGAAGSIKGRLLDEDGKPLAGVVVDVRYRQRVAEEIHNCVHRAKQIVSDDRGAFALDDLIPEQKFELSFQHGTRKFERTPKLVNPAIEVKAGESHDLGTLKLKRIVEQPGG
jgi:RNA polymerase sigma factor (sigma-70 family)